jgi:hypothetical protein
LKKDKTIFLDELNENLQNPSEFKPCFDELKSLLNCLIGLIEKEITAGQQVSNTLKTLKNLLLFFIQFDLVELLLTALELITDLLNLSTANSGILQAGMVKCIYLIISHKLTRTSLSLEKRNQMINYLLDCIIPTGSNDAKKDLRGSSFEIGLMLCLLWADAPKCLLNDNAKVYLGFITKYINSYEVEGQINQFFICASINIIFHLDMDNLDLTLEYLQSVMKKCLDNFQFKAEIHQDAILFLSRIYFTVSNYHLLDDDGKLFNKSLYRKLNEKALKLLFDIAQCFIRLEDYAIFLNLAKLDSILFENADLELSFQRTFSILSCFAELARTELCDMEQLKIKTKQSEADKENMFESDSVNTDSNSKRNISSASERGPTKKKTRPDLMQLYGSRIAILLNENNPNRVVIGLQTLIIIIRKYPTSAQLVMKHYSAYVFNLCNSFNNYVREFARLLVYITIGTYIPGNIDYDRLWDTVLATINDEKEYLDCSVLLLSGLMKNFEYHISKIKYSISIISKKLNVQSINFAPYIDTLMRKPQIWDFKNFRQFLENCMSSAELRIVSDFNNWYLRFESILKSKNNPSKTLFPFCSNYVGSEYATFEHQFRLFEERLFYCSGFSGDVLIDSLLEKCIPPANEQEKTLDFTDIFPRSYLDLFVDILRKTILEFNSASGGLLFVLTICQVAMLHPIVREKIEADNAIKSKLCEIADNSSLIMEKSFKDLVFIDDAPFKLSSRLLGAKNIQRFINQLLGPELFHPRKDVKTNKLASLHGISLFQESKFGQEADYEEMKLLRSRVVSIAGLLRNYEDEILPSTQELISDWVFNLIDKNTSLSYLELALAWPILVRFIGLNFIVKVLGIFQRKMNGRIGNNWSELWKCATNLIEVTLKDQPNIPRKSLEYRTMISKLLYFLSRHIKSMDRVLQMNMLQIASYLCNISDSSVSCLLTRFLLTLNQMKC